MLAILAAAFGVYWIAKPATTTDPATAGTGSTGGVSGTTNSSRPSLSAKAAKGINEVPLKMGSACILVAIIQKALNTKYNAGLKQDGEFGPKTFAALVKNKLSTVLYWKQFYEITGFPVGTGGTLVTNYTE